MACLIEERLRLALDPATLLQGFLPLACAHSSRDKKASPDRPPLTFRPFGCGPVVPDLFDCHRDRNSAARTTERTRQWLPSAPSANETGFSGTIKTLNLNVKVRIARVENPSDKGPQFRIFAGANVELGAAWRKRSEQTGNDYLSVKLDDPSFPAAIYATLTQIEGEEGYQLIWSRPTRD